MPEMPIYSSAPVEPAETDRRRAVLLATLCLGVLVAQVDTSVVNLAIEPISAAFGASAAALQWVADGYNLTYAILLLSGGLVADLYGRRRIFRIGAAIIGVASLACALAPSIGVLIAARVIAGAGAAMLLPASLAIVRVAWPEERLRRRALGVWASCNGLAFVIGPTVGGLLIKWYGWRSVFLIAIPLVAVAFVVAGIVVSESTDVSERRFDLPGQILGAIGLGALVFAAIDGHQGGAAWVESLAIAAVALATFLRIERMAGTKALVPLVLFRQRAFFGAIVATAAMTFGIYGMIFLLPLLWQASGVLGPEGTGLALLPCALVFFIVSQRSGHLANQVGVRILTAGGTATIGCGLIVLAGTHGGQALSMAEIGLALTGVGMGLNTGPLMSVAVGAVEASRSGTAAALINVARMIGATLGVALLGTAFVLWGGGADGLRAAMLAGASIQLAAAALAWATIRG